MFLDWLNVKFWLRFWLRLGLLSFSDCFSLESTNIYNTIITIIPNCGFSTLISFMTSCIDIFFILIVSLFLTNDVFTNSLIWAIISNIEGKSWKYWRSIRKSIFENHLFPTPIKQDSLIIFILHVIKSWIKSVLMFLSWDSVVSGFALFGFLNALYTLIPILWYQNVSETDNLAIF